MAGTSSSRWIPFVTSFVACAALGVLAVACTHAGSSAATRSAADVASFCDGLCGRISSCDSTSDAATCRRRCASENPAFGKIRGDVVQNVESCVAKKDCRTVLSNQLLSTCLAEARAAVTPVEATASFCTAMESSAKQCGNEGFERGGCLESFKLFSDGTLQKATTCAGKACADIGACVDAELAIPSSSDPRAANDPCLSPPPCPADAPLDEKSLAECHRIISDARCGDSMRALLGCSLAHAACGSDGKTATGVPSACKNELEAAAQCKSAAASWGG